MSQKIVPVCCRVCKNILCLSVDEKGFDSWQNGKTIQNALPELSAEDRELLISKTCEKCWNQLFEDDEI